MIFSRSHIFWEKTKVRFENSHLNNILFGSFSVVTSTFIYRYTMINSSSGKIAQSIDIDMLFLSTLLFFASSASRYIGHFCFIQFCPSLIQSNLDTDDLLKKRKTVLVDDAEWPSIYAEQISLWNETNEKHAYIRFFIGFTEVMVFCFYLAGVVVFCRSVLASFRAIILG